MKKRTAAAMLSLLILVFAACGSDSGNAQGSGEDSTETALTIADIASLSDEEYEAAYLLEPASQRTINIGYNGGLCQVAIPIAQELGFFEAEGLTTQITRSDSARDAIVGGLIDTSAGMIAEWLVPISNGVNVVFTLGLHTGCASAVVLVDSDIESFEDAVGEIVGVGGDIGGIYHNIAYRMVAHDGFVADDFTWRAINAEQSLLLLEGGDIQVAVIQDQLAEQWIQEGRVKRIRSLTLDEDFMSESCCVLCISEDFIAENPITSEKISRAIYKASLWLQESEANKEQAAQILIENGHISGSIEYAIDLMNLYTFGIPNELAEKSLYDSVDEYKALGVLSEDLDADELKDRIWQPFDLERLTIES